ncbi:hypothetical protein [Nannocystis sp. SCPEA4]|uniref:hypothetical protein n=1 Tax=Nannocystis sp. SCPEA4 TaxID=2996787 RepID=UPI0022706D8E|nr:hypothetical protein [Nannocystis sp. SCPEA4]MCY1059078.1 hypothetical protein [Nannocystis sp. SCPEA4]
MTHYTRSLSLFMFVSILGGCVLQPELIGESLSTDSGPVSSDGDTTDSTPGHGSAGTTPTSTVATVAPGPVEYGASCQLLGVPESVQSKAISLQPDCAGGICVFQFEDTPPPCSDDSDCAAPWPTCDGNFCDLDQDFVAASSRCTQNCQEDADCPAIPGCASETVCAPATLLAPLCCEKVCLCRDDLNIGATADLENLCQQPGTCGP